MSHLVSFNFELFNIVQYMIGFFNEDIVNILCVLRSPRKNKRVAFLRLLALHPVEIKTGKNGGYDDMQSGTAKAMPFCWNILISIQFIKAKKAFAA